MKRRMGLPGQAGRVEETGGRGQTLRQLAPVMCLAPALCWGAGLLLFGLSAARAESEVPQGQGRAQAATVEIARAESAKVEIAGAWQVRVTAGSPDKAAKTGKKLRVAPPSTFTVVGEPHDNLPLFDPKAAAWRRGARLKGVVAEECTTQDALDPESLRVFAGVGGRGKRFRKGVDYEADLAAGTVGRLAGGAIAEGQPVYISYRYRKQRLDSIVQDVRGQWLIRQGEPHVATPALPPVAAGERRVANLYLFARGKRLTEENLFPVLEERFPEEVRPGTLRPAEILLPRTMAKLRNGSPLRILAWGDSVSTYNRYQSMFVEALRKRFPKAKIELITEAWGGRNTGSYLKEPKGSEHNYQEKVLARMPDLILSEFVNDAGLDEAKVEERYGQLRTDFQRIGAEWIILTPHYIRLDWMNLKSQKGIDEDPRPYVKGVRAFAAKHRVALADGSLRYGRLWRQGIPFLTLMENNINHPNLFGHQLFADSLIALFP